MIYSRRRLFGLSLAAVATTATGTEALAKAAHHAKHSVTKHAAAHSVHGAHSIHGHGHNLHLAKASHCHTGHGHHTTLAKGVTRRGVAKPYLAKNFATGDAGCAVRKVSLRNLHTEECLETVYFEDGQYIPEAMQKVRHVLRDFRNGQQHEIEPQLIDLLDTVRARTGTHQPFHVISGYRSPQTNAMLHDEHENSGVANHSLHMQGEAIDIRLPDVALDHLRNAAFGLQRGGVGYYPSSNFVHVDVGDVRHWGFSA
jgi:uncharacterized protein YcbK (DUF882 family)